MQMSDHELLYEYRHAVNPAAQIKVLAELNAVSVGAMRNKLLDLGAELPDVTITPRNLTASAIDGARAWELYNEGLCDHDMAETLGVSKKTVANWRQQNDLKCHRAPPGYIQSKIAPQAPEPEEAPPEPTEPSEPAMAEVLPPEPQYMSVEGLLRVTEQMHKAFPQAVITAGGRYLRDIRVHIAYNADGEVVSAEMELITEEEI